MAVGGQIVDNFVFWITRSDSLDDIEGHICPYVDRVCSEDCRALKHSDIGWICTREQNEAITANLMAVALQSALKE